MNGRSAIAFISGVLFAVGLAVGGMTDPTKVQAFLDIGGEWDPSLLFVMGAAIAIYAPAYWWVTKRERPLLSERWHIPDKGTIDTKLLLGAALFGVGWGLAGYCPGPALTSLGQGRLEAFVFVAAMLGGMLTLEAWNRRRDADG